MAGFERYYGAKLYSPKQIKQDQTLSFGPKGDFNDPAMSAYIKSQGFRPKDLTGDNPIKPESKVLTQVVKFAEAIPYVQLSHSLDSVRSYGWEAHFSNDLIPTPVNPNTVLDTASFQKPLTLAVKSFSGLRFTTQASPIGIIGIGPTGQFTLTTPQPGTFTMAFDDLLDVNIGVRLFNMFKPQKTFNLNLYKFDGNKTLKTHFFMKDVVVTSIKQSDLNYSNTREFSSYEVEFMVKANNFYISGQYIDNDNPNKSADQILPPTNSGPID